MNFVRTAFNNLENSQLNSETSNNQSSLNTNSINQVTINNIDSGNDFISPLELNISIDLKLYLSREAKLILIFFVIFHLIVGTISYLAYIKLTGNIKESKIKFILFSIFMMGFVLCLVYYKYEKKKLQ